MLQFEPKSFGYTNEREINLDQGRQFPDRATWLSDIDGLMDRIDNTLGPDRTDGDRKRRVGRVITLSTLHPNLLDIGASR